MGDEAREGVACGKRDKWTQKRKKWNKVFREEKVT